MATIKELTKKLKAAEAEAEQFARWAEEFREAMEMDMARADRLEDELAKIKEDRDGLLADYRAALYELEDLRYSGDFSDAPDGSIHASLFLEKARKKLAARLDSTNG